MPPRRWTQGRGYNRPVDERLPSISVFATGETTIAPDLALVSLAVSATGAELPPARDDVNRRSSAVLSRLRELGLAEADISAPDVSIQPEYDYRKGQRGVLGSGRVGRRHARSLDLVRAGGHDAVEHLAQPVQLAHVDGHLARHAVADQALALAIVVLGLDRHVGRADVGLSLIHI